MPDRAREQMTPEELADALDREAWDPTHMSEQALQQAAAHLRSIAALSDEVAVLRSDWPSRRIRVLEQDIAALERDRDVWRTQADEARGQTARAENALSDCQRENERLLLALREVMVYDQIGR